MINYYYKSMRFCSLHIGDFELAPISQPIHEKQEDILPFHCDARNGFQCSLSQRGSYEYTMQLYCTVIMN